MELLNQMDGFDQTTNVKVGIVSCSCCPCSSLLTERTEPADIGRSRWVPARQARQQRQHGIRQLGRCH